MNPRIKELYKQARQIPGHEGAVDDPYMADHELRFAELIVRECADELIKWKDEPFPYDPEFGARLIKDLFGVKP